MPERLTEPERRLTPDAIGEQARYLVITPLVTCLTPDAIGEQVAERMP